jgi:hypothetical protein
LLVSATALSNFVAVMVAAVCGSAMGMVWTVGFHFSVDSIVAEANNFVSPAYYLGWYWFLGASFGATLGAAIGVSALLTSFVVHRVTRKVWPEVAAMWIVSSLVMWVYYLAIYRDGHLLNPIGFSVGFGAIGAGGFWAIRKFFTTLFSSMQQPRGEPSRDSPILDGH